jgi:hypothetical protein
MAAKDAPPVEGDVDAIGSTGGMDQASLIFINIKAAGVQGNQKTHVRRLDGAPSCKGILLGINVGPSC